MNILKRIYNKINGIPVLIRFVFRATFFISVIVTTYLYTKSIIWALFICLVIYCMNLLIAIMYLRNSNILSLYFKYLKSELKHG